MARKPLPTTQRPRFWESVPLAQMRAAEWEALCDGCGRCCLLKIEDSDTAEVAYTSVACRLFDAATCRCGNYDNRKRLVPGCVVLSPKTLPQIARWMPRTCAYRLLHEGRRLPAWHPLVTGRAESTAEAGIAVGGFALAEYDIPEDELEDHIIEGML